MSGLQEVVTRKITEFEETDSVQDTELQTTERISLFQIMMRYSSVGERAMLFTGVACTVIFGGALPAQTLLFGDMFDSIGVGPDGFDILQEQALWMCLIGVVAFVFAFLFSFLLALFAEKNTFKIRIKYFESVLKKDSAWFELNNPAEMGTRIYKETAIIQRAFGQKIGMIIVGVSSFLFAYGFAFYWGWKLTLVLLAAFPVMALMFGSMVIMLQSGTYEQMREYAQSAGYAEQALQAIKVVHTYGQEILEKVIYDSYLWKVTQIGKTQAFRISLGRAVLTFFYEAFLAYCFFFGGYFQIEEEKKNPDEANYSGGKVIAIFFAIMIGAIRFGGAVPHVKGAIEG